jgi:hypothetical protein
LLKSYPNTPKAKDEERDGIKCGKINSEYKL